MRLYAIQASRSGASVMGAAEALCKWIRPCQHCGRIINFGGCNEHEKQAPKLLVYLTMARAQEAARRLNDNTISANVHYTAVLCRLTQ